MQINPVLVHILVGIGLHVKSTNSMKNPNIFFSKKFTTMTTIETEDRFILEGIMN